MSTAQSAFEKDQTYRIRIHPQETAEVTYVGTYPHKSDCHVVVLHDGSESKLLPVFTDDFVLAKRTIEDVAMDAADDFAEDYDAGDGGFGSLSASMYRDEYLDARELLVPYILHAIEEAMAL